MERRTVREVYERGRNTLSRAGLQSPAFDALCLMERAFGIGDRAALAVRGGDVAAPEAAALFDSLIERRTREPLQYILGRWEFDGMPLRVGEGVLIPREDTMTLVEAACAALSGRPAPVVLDLCAGSGAVGLAIARRIPGAQVICVEKSPRALCYLRSNIAEFGQGRVRCVEGDVLQPPERCAVREECDCIVSNPPYIPSADVEGLQWEVRCEPRMALDGGSDGLTFYRAICELWKPLLKTGDGTAGGILAFETGYDIRDGVIDVMRRAGVGHIDVVKDFGGIDRCIFGAAVSKMQISSCSILKNDI